jgi:hypothetical protein
MKVIIVSVLLLTTTVSQAQRFSAGMRSGIGLWKGSIYNNGQPQGYVERNTTWEKELFIRYESGRHFAYEVGVSTVNGVQQGVPYGFCGTGGSMFTESINAIKVNEQYYSLNLRIQYGINCKHIRGLSNYPGVAIAPTLQVYETKYLLSDGMREYYSDSYNNKAVVMQYALEDMVRYQVSKHVDIHSIIACRFNNNGSLLKHAFTMQAGIAYRF